MFCCLGTPKQEKEAPLIVDLNEVLCNKAWRNFRASMGPCQRLAWRRNKFEFEIAENFFDFETIDQKLQRETNIIAPGAPDISKTDGVGAGAVQKVKVPSFRELTNPEVVTMDTDFKNDTAQGQTYKFRLEKTRKSEINVTFQKGFTFGGKANFNIGLPIGIDTHVQYEVTKSEGQRFEETMLMEATSDIAVGPASCCTANIQLEERALHATFTVTTRMSMPQKRAPVYIRRKSDKERVFEYYVKNLMDVFGYGEVPCAQEVPGCVDKIDFVIEGVVKGLLACNHKIKLTSDEPDELKNKAKEIKASANAAERRGQDGND